MLIVNDFEIGALADVETRDSSGAHPRRGRATRSTRRCRSARCDLVVAHFPGRRDRGDARGRTVRSGVRGDAGRSDRRRQRRGRRFRRGRCSMACTRAGRSKTACGSATPAPPRRCARFRRPRGVATGRGMPGARGKMGFAAGAGLTRGAPCGRRGAVVSSSGVGSSWRLYPHRIIFVRHGETSYNAESRLQGQRDIPLNGRGREQASAVGRSLRDELAGELARLDAVGAFLRLATRPHATNDGAGARRDGPRARALPSRRRR